MCFQYNFFDIINLFSFGFEDLCTIPAPRVTLSMWTSTVSGLQKIVNDVNYRSRIGQWSFIDQNILWIWRVNYYTFTWLYKSSCNVEMLPWWGFMGQICIGNEQNYKMNEFRGKNIENSDEKVKKSRKL